MDIKEGRTVKGINFEGIKDAGDPIELAKKYVLEGADELVFLDITATQEKRKTLVELVSKIAANINIPFTVGGGINTIEDATLVIESGADKVSINSSAVNSPNLISTIASKYGNQCVVVAIDIKQEQDKEWHVYTSGGKIKTKLKALEWALEAQSRGAGEILLTSMNSDGTKNGFELDFTGIVSRHLDIPVIASGGAGSVEHFKELFEKTEANAGLAASIFHYNELSISQLKNELRKLKLPIR